MNKQSSGGKARAESLSPVERREIAIAGAQARWAKAEPDRATLPKAIFGADDRPLKIGEIEIPCYVLEDERRMLTAGGMQSALGIAQGGSMKKGMSRLELFASGKGINPYLIKGLYERVSSPIIFITPSGSRAYGYEAELLVELCEAILAARADGALQKQQLSIAQQCEIIVRGLARIGIVALVDEVTGFQEVRRRNALHEILQAYIAPELLPWAQRFPDAFYREIFRLHGWKYDPLSVKRPGVVGKFTNQFIYNQLPEGVLEDLKCKNPKNEKGHRRVRHHQYLTEDIGHPHLEKQITKTLTLLQAADNWLQFKRLFARVFGEKGVQEEMDI